MGLLYNQTLEQCNLTALTQGIAGDGCVDGFDIGESSPAAMSILCPVGSVEYGKANFPEVSPQNVTVTAADATNARKDLVTYNSATSEPIVVVGSPAPSPVPPNIPAGNVLLAIVHVAANATSIVNADIEDGRVFVDPVPVGTIRLWYGLLAAVPTGWQLCDGTNSTPDMRGRFARGPVAAVEAGSTGGADLHTLTIAEMPSHTHNMNNGTPGGSACAESDFKEPINRYPTSSTGGDGAHNNMPAYVELIYIMKV